MAKTKWDQIEDVHQRFIDHQKLFFVATAALDGRVNMAPKDGKSLRVAGPNRIVWVNLTGAENETAAHVLESTRMTLMWCSFDNTPMILRAYGNATVIHPRDNVWAELIAMFPQRVGSRQIIDLSVDFVLKSCGFGVPLYEFSGYRDTLENWEANKGAEGVHHVWANYNQASLDGKPTQILDDED